MSQLMIKNLHVEVEGKEILKGIDLTVADHEIHALMGPNGNGKSTLLAAIMGHPKYTVTQGTIELDGRNVLEMSVDERSRAGLFLAMQYPQEVPGVTNSDFLRAAMNARRENPISLFAFIKEMEKTIQDLQMKPDLAHRFLNEGFSGGEKKRNEIVQMKMLKPSLAMLDEIDSGLDVDALKIVADAVNQMQQETGLGLVVVSHVLINGRIVMEGDETLVQKIDQDGYDWLYQELDLQPVKEEVKLTFTLGSCAASARGRKHD